MAQTHAQQLAAARQKRRREKLLAAERERDELRAEMELRDAEIERLEAELEDALTPGHAPRCPRHGCELACPQCHREGSWDA